MCAYIFFYTLQSNLVTSVGCCRQVFPRKYCNGELVVGNIGRRPQLVESQQNTLCRTTKLVHNGQRNCERFIFSAVHFSVFLWPLFWAIISARSLLWNYIQSCKAL